ncbi:hypothetical protein [Streptomyces benahoarensis]|uniref:Excreted virulence factor EspC, type VII ESX diderm n=1 Tax=Streptomyces benahoarensis TaxID=2595054 RepID=A0A553ZQY0_9ACTN|nr:hypothetical protein [Streptomyces benahoarensis]TSB32794.1 hypothetical protein FNJ62_00525 [Streptomyces benahoarensis]TSB43879.1 hypothetical protein FNZ23_02160 [Streptomyces benahoarensis]
MTINGDGFSAEPEELRGGASDILKCLKPAEDVDFEAMFKGFDGSEQSDVVLSGKFQKFCSTWTAAYLSLGDRSVDAAGHLKTTARNYEQADAYANGRLHS